MGMKNASEDEVREHYGWKRRTTPPTPEQYAAAADLVEEWNQAREEYPQDRDATPEEDARHDALMMQQGPEPMKPVWEPEPHEPRVVERRITEVALRIGRGGRLLDFYRKCQ